MPRACPVTRRRWTTPRPIRTTRRIAPATGVLPVTCPRPSLPAWPAAITRCVPPRRRLLSSSSLPTRATSATRTRTPAWADQQVRQWHKRDYQKPVLERAALVDAARRGDWRRLGAILAYIGSKDRDEIFAASLLRLLHRCESPAKWPVVIKALQEDSSPLVRAAAAQTLEGCATEESLKALVKATADGYLLVRVRAARRSGCCPDRATPRRAAGGGWTRHGGVAGGAQCPPR